MSEPYDCIVVGSGISGAQAAQTLLDGGRAVLMLDVGNEDSHYRPLVPDADFVSVREQDRDQHRYFLGDRFEGVPWGAARHTLTPPRQFITRDVDRWLPTLSDTFNPMESLAYGGLGNGWGAGCAAYPDPELRAMGLCPDAMQSAYPVVARRIGIAAVADDAAPFCMNGLAPADCLAPMQFDANIAAFYAAYRRKRARLNRLGVFVGRPPMAVLTEDRGGRRATRYNDMEFWTDVGNAVYRPRVTVDALRQHPRFTYRDHSLATRFVEDRNQFVQVEVLRTDTGETQMFRARRLLLATGTLGTARIVMRSDPTARRLPILTNNYALLPSLHLRQLGAAQDRRKTSMGQLVMYYDADGSRIGARMLAMYTYRSLLLFKLAKEAPFDLRTSMRFMRRLAPGLIIASISHPDAPSTQKYLERQPDPDSPTGDRLHIHYELSTDEQAENAIAEKAMFKAMRKLGAYPLTRQTQQAGSSVHYSGCLPIRQEETRHHLLPNGRLAGTRCVFVVDGSGFGYLPSNGLTFSIMVHAHLVAEHLVRESVAS